MELYTFEPKSKRKYFWWVGGLLLLVGLGWWWPKNKQVVISPEAPWIVVEKPLEKYSFPKLRERAFTGSEIEVGDDLLADGSGVFYYTVDERRVSGQIHVPTGTVSSGGFPVVVMLRGYVDQEIYETGIGTQRAAEVFAKNGFITLAPDFLGFGESDMPPNNSLEERFMRPMQVLELIASVKNLEKANAEKISIWGHSNGGQIALSVLEISGQDYPTSLWAPVSKPFPYSIFYYTDEFDDYGKALRKVVAGFEAQYDADVYSIHSYYDWVKASVQIHQGTNDDAVPVEWSQDLEKALSELDKEVKLYVYSGADHNLVGAWNEAVARDVGWFRK